MQSKSTAVGKCALGVERQPTKEPNMIGRMNPIDSVLEAWKSLSKEEKTVAGILGAVDTAAKGIALWDLARTDAERLRGPKWFWTAFIGVANTIGWASYFTIGKKRGGNSKK